MKEILQEVKEQLEQAYSHPEEAKLEQCIQMLEDAKQQYGDRGTMIEDVIRSLTQAKNATNELEQAGDISSSAAYGEAFNGLEQAIESYSRNE